MDERNDIQYNSSQEIILFSSQTMNESDDDYQPSTQEIITNQTQEASNASDFFENLRESQITSNDLPLSQPNEDQMKIHDLTDVSIDTIDSYNDFQPTTEKKKRGRKRKIRTPEEMEIHLKEKKEKNRLAAQRLRQKKGSEIAKYDLEVTQLEANVRAKRQFAELIESNVNQLRNKIKIMFGPKAKDAKLEAIENNGSTSGDSLNSNSNEENSDQKKNKKKSNSNHFCISR